MDWRLNRERAFTLAEVLLVVVILSLLAALTAPLLADKVEEAAEAAALTNLEAAQAAVNVYKAREGVWPEELSPDMFRDRDVPRMPEGWALEYDNELGVVSLVQVDHEIEGE